MKAPASAAHHERGREALILEVCRSALEPGHWDQLRRDEQDALLQRWRPELHQWPTKFLEQLASPATGSPCVLVDDELNLHYSQKNRRRARRPTGQQQDALKSFIEQANRLGALVLGHDMDGTPVTMAMDNLDTHMAVLGVTGVGKTVLVSNLFVQLASRGGPMLLLDPHDDFIRTAIPNLPPDRLKDVVYIDPSDVESTWGINVLQLAREFVDEGDPDYAVLMQRMIDQSVSYIVDALSVLQEDTTGYQAGPSIRSLMRAGFMAASEREDTSLVDVYSLLTKADVQDLVVPTLLRHHVRDYFQDTVRELNREYLERVRNKLEVFLSTPLINTMCRRDECMSIPELLNQNKIVVVDLNRVRLSPTISSLIGYLILIISMFAIDRRELLPRDEQVPLYAFVGEFSNFASRIVMRWLAEARKKRAGLVMDLQHLDQLPDEVEEALGNVGTLAAFRSSVQDAPQLCRLLGLTTETGQPLVDEMLQLPRYVVRLQYDEVDGHSERPSTARSMVTVRSLPPMPMPQNHEEILARVRRRSRALFWKRNQVSDQRTTYSEDVVGSQTVLQAVWEANLAVGRPETYRLETTNDKARWALQNGVATQTLIQAILEAKGYQLARGHFRQILNSLRVQELIRVRKTPNGYLHTEPTRRGVQQIRSYVVPNLSSNEGGSNHQQLLLRLYRALCSWAPLPLTVPPQLVEKYTPDLILDRLGDKVPVSLGNVLTSAESIHFHVEHGTRTKPMKIAGNIEKANASGADPIIVIHIEDQKMALQTSLSQVDVLTRSLHGPEGTRSRSSEGKSRAAPYRLWLITPKLDLLEYDIRRHRVVPVSTLYQPAPAAAGPPSASGKTDALAKKVSPAHKPAKGKHRIPPTAESGQQKQATAPRVDRTEAVFKQVVGNLILEPAGQGIDQAALREALGRHAATRDLPEAQIDDWMESMFLYRREDREGSAWYVSI